MITSEVSSLNETVQKTHEWLRELAEIGRFYGDAQAYTALHAVLHTLRDRLPVDEAAHLGAQLPTLIRGVYYEGWRPASAPVSERTQMQFVDHVARRLGNAEIHPAAACRAVFQLLDRRITRGEVEDVRHMLPRDIRALWDHEGG